MMRRWSQIYQYHALLHILSHLARLVMQSSLHPALAHAWSLLLHITYCNLQQFYNCLQAQLHQY